MKKIISKEFIIGLCVLVGLVILYFGINYLKGVNLFKPGHYYYVEYDNIAGLETAAPVRIDGYKVGEVREIEFNYNKPGKIRVALSLNKNLKIPVDSHALIVSGLMSGPSIDIVLGQSNKFIAVEGIIPGAIDKGLMEAVSQDILPNVSNMIPHIDSLIMSLGYTADNLVELSGKEEIGASVRNIELITSDLASLSSSLNKSLSNGVPTILNNTNEVINQASDAMGSANGIMGTAQEVADNIKQITLDVAEVTKEFKNLPLQTSMQNVEKATANLEELSRRLNSTTGTLGKLLNDPTLYYELTRVASDIDSLVNDVKANPKRYINIKLL